MGEAVKVSKHGDEWEDEPMFERQAFCSCRLGKVLPFYADWKATPLVSSKDFLDKGGMFPLP